MSKRGAKIQINQLNPEAYDEHDSDDEGGDSLREAKIDRSLLERREITKPKRPSERIARIHSGNSSTTASPNPFAKLNFSNPSLNFSNLSSLQGSPLSSALQTTNGVEQQHDTSKELYPYALHVKGLNMSFKKHVVQCLEQDALVDLSSCFESYQKHFDSIKKLKQSPVEKEPVPALFPVKPTTSESKGLDVLPPSLSLSTATTSTTTSSPFTKAVPLPSSAFHMTPAQDASDASNTKTKDVESSKPNISAPFSFSTPASTAAAPFGFSFGTSNVDTRSQHDKKEPLDNERDAKKAADGQATPLTATPVPFSFSLGGVKGETNALLGGSNPFSATLPTTATPSFSPIVSPGQAVVDSGLVSSKPAAHALFTASSPKPAAAAAAALPSTLAPAQAATSSSVTGVAAPIPTSFSFGLSQPSPSEAFKPLTTLGNAVPKSIFSFGTASEPMAKPSESADAKPRPSESTEKQLSSPVQPPVFSFGTVAPSSSLTGFSFSQPAPGGTSAAFSFGSTATGSSTLSSAAPAPFSFSSATPFSFAPPASKGSEGQEEEESKGEDDGEEGSEEAPPAPAEMDPYTQGPGEEGESTLFALRCKLYHFSTEAKKWVDLGIGSLRLNRLSNGSRKSRLLIRAQSGTGQILLNFVLFAKMDPELIEKTNSVSFFGLNLQGKPAKYLIRVKSQALAKELYDKLLTFKSEQ